MPFANFEAVQSDADVLRLFETQFPDALPLMGRERLLHDYAANPTGALVSIKVRRVGVRTPGSQRLTVLSPHTVCAVPLPGQRADHGRRGTRDGAVLRPRYERGLPGRPGV
jgi:hypothetical protein